jgi:hypothetical protein
LPLIFIKKEVSHKSIDLQNPRSREKENKREEVAVDTTTEGGESSFSPNLEEKCAQEGTSPGILIFSRTRRLLHTYSHGRLYKSRCA